MNTAQTKRVAMLSKQIAYLEIENGYIDNETGKLFGYPTDELPTGEDDPVGKAAKVITHHILKVPPKDLNRVFIPLKEEGQINVNNAEKK